MGSQLKVVGICGSIRKESYNKALLRAAAEHLPADVEYIEADLTLLPFYNQDLESTLPQSVTEFAEALRQADGLIIAAPEYNYSFSGVLKNALEWVSRPATGQPIAGKPVAIVGASAGMFGPARGHMHLRQVLFACNTNPVNRPEVNVNNAKSKFNDRGELTDAAAHDFLDQLIGNLVESMRKQH